MFKIILFSFLSLLCSVGSAQYGYKDIKLQPPRSVIFKSVVCSTGERFSLLNVRLMVAESQALVFYNGRLEIITNILDAKEISFWKTNQKNVDASFDEHRLIIHNSKSSDNFLSAGLLGPNGYEELICTQLDYN